MTTSDTIRLASEALDELDGIRAADEETARLTSGPRLVLWQAVTFAARQNPAGAAASVRGAAGTAGAIIQGLLARRPHLLAVCDGRLRDVSNGLVSISQGA